MKKNSTKGIVPTLHPSCQQKKVAIVLHISHLFLVVEQWTTPEVTKWAYEVVKIGG
jgi:hypothetical protein